MARKLSPGVHNVTIKGKRRRVRVMANGQWRFLKSSSSRPARPATRRTTRTQSRRRASPKRRSASTTRRRPMAKKRRTTRTKTMHLLPTIVGLNAVVQMTEPFVPAVMAGLKGDAQGAMSSARSATKEALSGENLTQALTPMAVLVAARAVKGIVGFQSPSLNLGGRRRISVF